MNRNRIAALALSAGLASAAMVTPNAEAAPVSYHILNSSPSYGGNVNIYSEVGCAGSSHILFPGDKAQSTGWDSFKGTRNFTVWVYDGETGATVAGPTSYAAWTCRKAWKTNDYRVQVL